MKTTTIVEYGTYHPNTPGDITWHDSEYNARDYAHLTKHKLVTRTKTVRPTLNSTDITTTLERDGRTTIVEKVTTTHQDGHTTQEGHTMHINETEDQPQDRIHVSGVDGIQDVYIGHNLNASVDLDGTLEITESNTTALAQYAHGKWNRWRRTTEKGQN